VRGIPASDLDQVLDELLEATGSEAAELFLREPGADRLWLAAHRGLAAGEFRQRTEFGLGEGFPGLVAESALPIQALDLGFPTSR
jgi:signal transduction protein with GAF and PtsI domain